MLLSFALRGLDLEFLEALADLPATSSASRSPENADDRRSRFRRDEPIAALRMRNRKTPKKSPSLPAAAAIPSGVVRLLNGKISAAQTKVVEFGPVAVTK